MKKTRYSSHWLGGGLLRQITVLALLTTTVLLTLFGWQRISSGNDRLTHNLHLTLETNSQWLATSLGLPLYNFDDATVTAICNSMLSHPDISQIIIRANGQTQTFSAVDVAEPKRLSANHISISNDITYYRLTLGHVEVYVSTKNLQQQIKVAGWTTLVQIVLLNFILVAALIFFISRSFIKPMAQLQQASDRIAEGDLQHPIKIKSSNELGLLANNLETMRMTLQGKISALETEVIMRSKVEKELTQTKNYIDNIINSMPSLLISVDDDLKVTQWNRRAEELTGVIEKDAIGKKIDELCPGLAGEQERIIEAINRRQVLHEGARISKKNNVIQYEDVTIYPLVTNGEIGAVVRIDDVTKEFQLRSELAHVRKLDAIGQLAGGVAHDFNNMLGGILGGAELLKRYIGDHEKGKQYLDVIIQSGNRAAELTEKLLAFARKGKMQSVPVDVRISIDDAVGILRHSIDKNIKITTTINTDDVVVIGDSGQLQNALINLGINASHAMPEGGKLSYKLDSIQLDDIFCAASPFAIDSGSFLDIEIHDEGAGIPIEEIDQIFEPFFTTKGQGNGTGLGLAAVYGTVQDHHGAITVYSEVGRGTVFHIYLPIVDRRVKERCEVKENIVGGSGKILVVDDEQVIRITAQGILESLGYTVLLANNGRLGLALFEKEAETIDLVLMDMVMPEMNGEESFYAMLKIAPSVKVLLASGFSRGADIEKLKKAGLRGFLAKPYTAFTLSKAVAAALQ